MSPWNEANIIIYNMHCPVSPYNCVFGAIFSNIDIYNNMYVYVLEIDALGLIMESLAVLSVIPKSCQYRPFTIITLQIIWLFVYITMNKQMVIL